MKKSDKFLFIGIVVSIFLHYLFFQTLLIVNSSEKLRKKFEKSKFVEFEVAKSSKPEPKTEKKLEPEPKIKPKSEPKNEPKIVKEDVKQLPVSNIREKPKEEVEADAKPVFGVTAETVKGVDSSSGIGIRVGNTLMKEQEKEYTPPEQVKNYYAGDKLVETKPAKPELPAKKFSPVPVMKISKMPQAISTPKPEYPKKLKIDEIEGSVKIKLGIDKTGAVVSADIVSSDHQLFSEAALKVVKTYKYKPAFLENGEAVDTEITVVIKFELDEF